MRFFKLHFSCFFILSLLMLNACSNGSSKNTSAGDDKAIDALSYFANTKSIIDSRCVTCHREGGQAPFALNNYEQINDWLTSVEVAVKNSSMPKPGAAKLTTQERQILLDWIASGTDEGLAPASEKPALSYTYYEHAKAIIDEKCAGCHQPDAIAPFSLTNYDEVYAVRAAIVHQVTGNFMPPWSPTNGYTKIKDNRSLSPEDKHVLLAWLDDGAPAGDEADFVVAHQNKPVIDYNLTITMPEAYTPVVKPDEYRCFIIDWPLEETVYVDAANVVPDAKSVVHHVFSVVIDPGVVPIFEEADAKDEAPGFPCWGAPAPEGAYVMPRTLTVWAPGITKGALPEGTGVKVEPGSKIVMQMHYNTLDATPIADQSSLELHYTKNIEREAVTLFFLDVAWYFPGGMPIPANDADVSFEYTAAIPYYAFLMSGEGTGLSAEKPFAMHSAFLHSHVLGKSTSIALIRKDGTKQMLVDIKAWDFNWQNEYIFEEEIIVNPGDQFQLKCSYDNSQEKQQFIDGVQLEPQYVEFGEGTVDEMCVNYFYVTRVKDDSAEATYTATVNFRQPEYRQQYQAGAYVPIELLVNNFQLREADASSSENLTGHYQIHLDNSNDVVTGWENSFYYKLPDDISAGEHTIRVSLHEDNGDAIEVQALISIVVNNADTSDLKSSSLVDVTLWQEQSEADDPLADHRPEDDSCQENSWLEEDGALEVQTGYCKYFSVAQKTKVTVNKGEQLHLVLWHGQLAYEASDSEESVDAHVAVSINGEIIWQAEIAIPSSAGIYDISFPSVVSADAGSIVEFHLHNHGYNTWTLLSLDVER